MSVQDIPVIHVGDLHDPETLRALDAACRDWGFFQVTGHDMAQSVLDGLHDAMRAFFAQSTVSKRAVSRTAGNPWGFYDRELTKNTLDWKEVYDYGPAATGGLAPQWPADVAGFRPAVVGYYAACELLAFRLLAAISSNLGMPEDYLSRSFTAAHSSFVRLNYYPICPAPARPEGTATPTDGHLGVNHHTDAGALTLLLQDDQAGLEVLRGGRWHRVAPRSDALVVNIGDIVQVWSNDRYRASLHRVAANSAAPRFSAPFFFNPDFAVDYAPLPSTVDVREPARYRPINWGEFRSLRAAGDYTDLGEEVQISHYQHAGRRS